MTDTAKLDLRGSRALVTGGSGFIGGRLCARLVDLGASVVTVSRRPGSVPTGVEAVAADLADLEAARRGIAEASPDIVFHLASHVVGARSVDAVIPTFASNLASTVNLLVAAQEADCRRVILTGSMEEPEPTNEWAIPSSPYAAAKAAAGSYGRMFNALFDLPVVILRVFMVYGPGQADRAKLVPYVITSLLNGIEPKVSSGTREVDWIFVDDVVDAYLAAATKPGILGETLDVGSGQLLSVRSIVESIYSVMKQTTRPRFGDAPDRPMEQVRRADVSRTERLLGWTPSTALSDGLARTVSWYSAQPEGG